LALPARSPKGGMDQQMDQHARVSAHLKRTNWDASGQPHGCPSQYSCRRGKRTSETLSYVVPGAPTSCRSRVPNCRPDLEIAISNELVQSRRDWLAGVRSAGDAWTAVKYSGVTITFVYHSSLSYTVGDREPVVGRNLRPHCARREFDDYRLTLNSANCSVDARAVWAIPPTVASRTPITTTTTSSAPDAQTAVGSFQASSRRNVLLLFHLSRITSQ
jgi:hypothetical protein